METTQYRFVLGFKEMKGSRVFLYFYQLVLKQRICTFIQGKAVVIKTPKHNQPNNVKIVIRNDFSNPIVAPKQKKHC